jgi:hypothetical protein
VTPERVTLPDGDWVDLTTRLNYAQHRRMTTAKANGLDAVTEGVAAMIVGWSLRDVNGQAIPLPPVEARGIPSAALDLIPFESMEAIADRAAELVKAIRDPKDGAGISPGSPPAPSSPSTPSSPTSTSSPIIPAGPGQTSSEPPPT